METGGEPRNSLEILSSGAFGGGQDTAMLGQLGPKIGPWGRLGPQVGAKMGHHGGKRGQDGPKMGQDRAKMANMSEKGGQDEAKEANLAAKGGFGGQLGRI